MRSQSLCILKELYVAQLIDFVISDRLGTHDLFDFIYILFTGSDQADTGSREGDL